MHSPGPGLAEFSHRSVVCVLSVACMVAQVQACNQKSYAAAFAWLFVSLSRDCICVSLWFDLKMQHQRLAEGLELVIMFALFSTILTLFITECFGCLQIPC